MCVIETNCYHQKLSIANNQVKNEHFLISLSFFKANFLTCFYLAFYSGKLQTNTLEECQFFSEMNSLRDFSCFVLPNSKLQLKKYKRISHFRHFFYFERHSLKHLSHLAPYGTLIFLPVFSLFVAYMHTVCHTYIIKRYR